MRLEKYSRADLRRIMREAYRELEEEKYENFVDFRRSHLDYNKSEDIEWEPLTSTDCSTQFMRKLDDRVDDIVRETMDGKYPKNEVKYGGIVITLPRPLAEVTADDLKAMSEEFPGGKPEVLAEMLKASRSLEFFDHAWNFFRNRYGAENVIDMVVHRDEGINEKGERVGEDHGTLYLVPQCVSRKNGKPTISAASRWDQKELQAVHRDLDKYMEQQYGIPHLIIRSEDERMKDPKNLTLREYKILMAQAGDQQAYADLTRGAIRKADKIVKLSQQKADAIIREAEEKAAEILAQARAQSRALPQVPQMTPNAGSGYDRTYA